MAMTIISKQTATPAKRNCLTEEYLFNEPHLFANNSGSVIWNGEGDNLYKLMAQNFTAEVAEFFMKGKAFSSIVSKQSSDPNVGRAEANKTYMMRIKMYKSSEIGSIPTISSSVGPPVGYGVAALGFYSGSAKGENYPFTPPYYHGQAWCDVTFTSTEARKYSIQEIIASSSIRQWRYVDDSNGDNHIITRHINGRRDDAEGEKGNSMPLNSSVNIFSQIEGRTIPDSNSGLVVPVLGETNDPPSRWVIQTKFETPMLNFNHLSASDSITLPQNASQSVPRGMWHQYGRIEESPDKGVFLQVTDVPSDWIDGYLRETSSTTGSLADLCGFSSEPVKLGQIADEKVLREAVVAAPFIEEDGERKFFRIPRIDIQRAKGDAEQKALVGESVIEMVEKMKHYVFPPPMDFMNNESIDPFVMYIFEFSHTLKKQDLANIWQNLYPEIGTNFETAQSSIKHELLAHELMGGGSQLTPEGLLDVNAAGNEIPDRVRWMVFKVKQRAKINYYEKIVGRNDDLPEASVTSQGANVSVSYNWPYDFFSLVELAKIESEVKFAKRAVKPGQEPRETIEAQVSNKILNPVSDTSLVDVAARTGQDIFSLDPDLQGKTTVTSATSSPLSQPTQQNQAQQNTQNVLGTIGSVLGVDLDGGDE
jgi:hypothetical protein